MYQYPFTLVTGSGLGTAYTSLDRNGKVVDDRAVGQADVQLYANVATGNLVVRDHGMIAEEMSGFIHLAYYYNSGSEKTPWRLGIPHLALPSKDKKQLTLIEKDGHETAYTYDDERKMFIAPACGDGRPTLQKDEKNKVWVWYDPKTARKACYDEQGLLHSMSDPAGRTSIFHYTQGELTSISAPSGCVYTIERQSNKVAFYKQEGNTKSLLQTHVFANQQLQTTYIGDKQQYTVDYRYENGLLNTITQSDGTKVNFRYNKQEKGLSPLSKVVVGDTEDYQIDYVKDNTVAITNAEKQKITLSMDNEKRLMSVAQSNGILVAPKKETVTRYTYTDHGQVKTVQKPNGALYRRQYTEKGALSLTQDPNGRSTYRWHDPQTGALCQVDRFYDDGATDVGKFLSTRYVYEQPFKGDPRNRVLRFSISPTGQVTEFMYDEKGNRQAKRVYLSQLYDLSPYTRPKKGEKFTEKHQITLKAIEAWSKEYLKDPQHKILLSAFEHNLRGQLVKSTTYNDVDQKHQGIDNDQTAEALFKNTYFGAWETKSERQTKKRSVDTQRLFDHLHRNIATTKGAQDKAIEQQTIYVFKPVSKDNNKPMPAVQSTILPRGQVISRTIDNRGYAIAKKEMAVAANHQLEKRETSLHRDGIGRLILTVTPDGQLHFTFYNLQNQLVYEVNAEGKVTSHTNNLSEHYSTTVDHDNPIALKQLYPIPRLLPTPGDVAALLIKNEQKDRVRYQFYDDSGRVRFALDSDNYLTETRYDTLSNPICTIRYATPLTADQIDQLKQRTLKVEPDAAKKDQVWNRYYNDENKLIATVDPSGYVIEQKRNVAGRVIEKIRYHNPYKNPGVTPRDFNQVRPEKSPQDAESYSFYDLRGRRTLRVNEEGTIVGYHYWANSLLAEKTVYATPVTKDWYKNTKVPPDIIQDKNDYSIVHLYDGLNRKSGEQGSDQKHHCVTYNKSDQVLTDETIENNTTALTDPDKRRRVLKRYDQWGQCIAICPAMVAQKLAEIDVDPKIKDKEKAKEAIWEEHSHRLIYDATGLNYKVINTLGKIRFYFYDSMRRPVLIIKPNGAVTEKTYTIFGEPKEVRQYKNKLTKEQLAILATCSSGILTDQIKGFLKKDKDDIVDSFGYDKRGHRIKHSDPEQYVIEKVFNSMGKVRIEKRPVQTKEQTLTITHEYENRGLETGIQYTAATGETIKIGKKYHNSRGKLTELTDQENFKHQFKHDRVGNQTEIIGPDNVLQHKRTFSALKQMKTDENALGDVTSIEHLVNDRKIVTKPPIEGTEITVDNNIFAQPVTKTNALSEKTQWEHAPTGAVAKTLRQINATENAITSKTFNTEGQVLTETDPLNVVDETVYDDNGDVHQHIVEPKRFKLTTTIERDSLGRPEYITNPRGRVDQKEYNTRSLVTKYTRDIGTQATPGLQLTTTSEYNAQRARTSSAQGDSNNPHLYQVAFQEDPLGRVTGKTVAPDAELIKGLNLTQLNTLNKKSKVVAHTDPKGHVFYLFYDAWDNKRFQVEANGSVTAWEYNKAKKATLRRQYKEKVSIDQISTDLSLSDLEKLLKPIESNEDSLYAYFYDKNLRECFTVTYYYDIKTQQYVGFLAEKRYNGASRVVTTVGYADYLDATVMNNLSYETLLTYATTNTNPENRYTFTVHNAMGKERFTIDPEGAVIEQKFDAKGRGIARIEYATLIESLTEREAIAKLSPDQIVIPKDPVNDRVSYNIFDVYDKPYFIIDAELAVSCYEHDDNGNLIFECHFEKPLKEVPKNQAEALKACLALTPDPKVDTIKQKQYDAVDQMHVQIDPYNYKDVYEHDALGNLREHTDRANNTWGFQYDAAKRLRLKISPKTTITTVKQNQEGKLEKDPLVRTVQELNRYDPNNNVTQVIKDYSEDNSTDPREIDLTYTAANRLKTTTLPHVQVANKTEPASFTEPPVKTVNLTETKVYDGKGHEVCSQDKNGLWSFNVYDSSHDRVVYRLRPTGTEKGMYSVLGFERNPFGDVIQETAYYDSIELDAEQYKEKGIPLAVAYGKIKTLDGKPLNRVTIKIRDRRGDIRKTIKTRILTYFPGSNKPSFANPEVHYEYDAFRQRILIEKVRFPGKGFEKLNEKLYRWLDRRGDLIASAEIIQNKLMKDSLLETPVTYRVVRHVRNVFRKEEELIRYEQPIPDAISIKTSMAELLILCAQQKDQKERTIKKGYDLLQRRTSKTRVNVTRQIGVPGKTLKPDPKKHHPAVAEQLAALQNVKRKAKSSEPASPNAKTRQLPHHTGTNHLLRQFMGNSYEQDQRRFTTWYTSDTCLYLMNILPNTSQALRYVFDDAEVGNNTNVFKRQFIALKSLSDKLKRPAVFVTKEPGRINHFITGVYSQGHLLLINPLGIPDAHSQRSEYQILADLQKALKLEIYFSSTFLQWDEPTRLVSCGPIALEIACHFLTRFSQKALEDIFTTVLNSKDTTTYQGLTYYSQNTKALLPKTLCYTLDDYPQAISRIRATHCRYFEKHPVAYAEDCRVRVRDVKDFCDNNPLQVLVRRMVLEHLTLDELIHDPLFKLVQEKDPLRYLLNVKREAYLTYAKATVKAENPDDLPSMHDVIVDVTESYQFTPTGVQYGMTDGNGNSKYSTIDERGHIVANTGYPYKNKQGELEIPLTVNGISAHGQKVSTQRFALGAKAVVTDPYVKPEPKGLDPEHDEETLNLFANRGLLFLTQDPEGHLKGQTYTEKGKIASQYWRLTTLEKTGPHSTTTKVHIDEKRWEHDRASRPIKSAWLRDNVEKESTSSTYDNFGEELEETGTNTDTNPKYAQGSYTRLNASGYIFNTDKSNHPVITLTDLTGGKTATIEATTTDLSTFKDEESIMDLFSEGKYTDLEMTEFLPDPKKRVLRKIDPAFHAHKSNPNTDEIEKIQLCIQASHLYAPEIGKTSLTWPKLIDSTFKPEFSIWPYGTQFKDATQLKIQEKGGMHGVDVSSLLTGKYHYRIDFYFTDPITGKSTLKYMTTGDIQFDSGLYNADNKATPFVVTEMKPQDVLWLSGNVADITEMQLWSNGGTQLVNTFKIEKSSNPNQIFVDLKNQKTSQGDPLSSGVYQCKVLRGTEVDPDFSFPFTLYTPVLSKTPLSREIHCQAQVLTLENHGELSIWKSLPKDYQTAPVVLFTMYNYYVSDALKGGNLFIAIEKTKENFNQAIKDWKEQHKDTNDVLLIEADYPDEPNTWTLCGIDANGDMVTVLVGPNTLLGEYIASLGTTDFTNDQKIVLFHNAIMLLGRLKEAYEEHQLTPDTNLGHYKDKSGNEIIANLTFQHTVNLLISIQLVLNVDSDNNLLLYQQSFPISNSDRAFVELGNKTYHQVVTLTTIKAHNRLGSQWSAKAIANADIVTWHFVPQTLAYITPLKGYDSTPEALPTLHYWNIVEGLNATWKELKAQSASKVGVLLNLTGMYPGQYPFWIDNPDQKNLTFSVADGSAIYTSDKGSKPAIVTVKVQNDIAYNVFDNKVELIVSDGDKVLVTKRDFNDLGKETATYYPESPVISTDGKITENLVTRRNIGYRYGGEQIGLRDPNDHVELNLLNPDGKTIAHILGDNTLALQNTWNPLQQKVAYADARGKVWEMTYNRTDQVLSIKAPNGVNTVYRYDEKNNRVSRTIGNNVIESGFDVKGYTQITVEPESTFGGKTRPKQVTENEYHRTGQMRSQIRSDNRKISYFRDFFGTVHDVHLLDTSEVTRLYDKKMQLIAEKQVTAHTARNYLIVVPKTISIFGLQLSYYENQIIPVPKQSLVFHYKAGLLMSVDDIPNKQTTLFIYDTLKRRIKQVVQLSNGEIMRVMNAQYDGKGVQILAHDDNATVTIVPDKAGNRIRIDARFIRNGALELNTYWNLPDPANRMKVDEGEMTDGVIHIAKDKGLGLVYKDNFRVSESMNRKGTHIKTDIHYGDGGRLTSTNSSNGTSTQVTYQPEENWIKEYRERPSGNYTITQYYSFMQALYMYRQVTYRNSNWTQIRNVHGFTSEGTPTSETLQFPEYSEQANFTNGFTYLQNERITSVAGNTYNDKGGWKTLQTAHLYTDSNDNPNAKVGSTNNEGANGQYIPEQIKFTSLYNGTMLSKQHFQKRPLLPENVIQSLPPFLQSIIAGLLGYKMQLSNVENLFVDPDEKVFAIYLEETDPRSPAPPPRYSDHGSKNIDSFLGGRWAGPHAQSLKGAFGRENDAHLPPNLRAALNRIRQSDPAFYGRPHAPYKGGFANRVLAGGHRDRFMITDPIQAMVANPVPYTFADYLSVYGMQQGLEQAIKGYSKMVPAPMSTYPSVSPRRYKVPKNHMNLFEISKAALGSERYASEIANENGWTLAKYCNLNTNVILPQVQMNTNSILDNPNYQLLMAAFIGNLSPHIDFKQPPPKHHSCLKTIIAIVISVVAIAIGAEFLGPMIAGMFGTGAIATGVGAAIGTAIADAALQGIAVGIGVLDHFSWTDVLESAFTAGLGSYLKAGKFLENFDKALRLKNVAQAMKILGEAVAIAGAVNVSEQLSEIALGMRTSFSIRAIVQAMTIQAVDMGLAEELPNTSDQYVKKMEQMFTSFTNTVVGDAIMGAPFNIEAFIEQEIGNEIGHELSGPVIKGLKNMAEALETVRPGEKYTQAQAAGKGVTKTHEYMPKAPNDSSSSHSTAVRPGQAAKESVTSTSNQPLTSVNQKRITDLPEFLRGTMEDMWKSRDYWVQLGKELYVDIGIAGKVLNPLQGTQFTPSSSSGGIMSRINHALDVVGDAGRRLWNFEKATWSVAAAQLHYTIQRELYVPEMMTGMLMGASANVVNTTLDFGKMLVNGSRYFMSPTLLAAESIPAVRQAEKAFFSAGIHPNLSKFPEPIRQGYTAGSYAMDIISFGVPVLDVVKDVVVTRSLARLAEGIVEIKTGLPIRKMFSGEALTKLDAVETVTGVPVSTLSEWARFFKPVSARLPSELNLFSENSAFSDLPPIKGGEAYSFSGGKLVLEPHSNNLGNLIADSSHTVLNAPLNSNGFEGIMTTDIDAVLREAIYPDAPQTSNTLLGQNMHRPHF